MTAVASVSTADENRWQVADRSALWEPAGVVGVERSPSATTLRLRLAQVPEVVAGQYYLFRLPIDGPPGAVQQAYSLSSSPFPPSPDIEITVREVRGGRVSPLLARRVQVGDVLGVRGPFGFLTWTESDGGPIGLIGAGSGVAPLASIVRYAADRGAETSMTMLCSSPDRRTALLREPLEELERRRGWFTLAHTFTRSPRDPLARFHRRIDTAMLGEVMGPRPEQLTERYYYVAGPAEMVVAVRAMLGACGVTDDRIYSEEHM